MRRHKMILSACCCLLLAAVLTGCAAEAPSSDTPEAGPPSAAVQTAAPPETAPASGAELSLQIGDKRFTAKLTDTPAAQALAARLPMTLGMDELNGNEKYFFLQDRLPTAAEAVGHVDAGDLMLYGDNCLVLFYEGFQTPYSYTRLGVLEDVSGLSEALGNGRVEVRFNLAK